MDKKAEHRLKILKAKKEQYFANIQRVYDFSRDVSTPEKLSYFKMRYTNYEATKVKLLETIEDINLLECELDEHFVPSFKIIETIEEIVCYIEHVAQKIKIHSSSTSSAPSTRSEERTNRIRKLPDIPLPKFSGDLKEWPLFIECFNSLIHNNPELNDVNRAHYLLGCLSDTALSVCSGIAPTGDNYRIILAALVDKYEDKRAIANSLLEQLFMFKQSPTENVHTLNAFVDKFDPAVTALRKLDIPDLADYILAYLAFQKLNPETQRLFENTRRKTDMPSYKDIITFIKEQAKICARTSTVVNKLASSSSSSKGYPVQSSNSNSKSKSTHVFLAQKPTPAKCACCKGTHYISACPQFLEITPEERYQIVRANSLCLNCLGSHKIMNCQSNYTCRSCHLKHHTLLHFKTNSRSKSDRSTSGTPIDNSSSTSNRNSSSSPDNAHGESNSSSINCCTITSNTNGSNNTVLLSTAKVDVLDVFDNTHEARFLLDSGSHANFLSLDFSRRLKLPLAKCDTTVLGIGSTSSRVHGSASAVIISKINTHKRYCLDVLVVDQITNQMPPISVDISRFNYLVSIPLADTEFHIPRKVDGIIGASLFAQLLGRERISGPPNTPLAIETQLGFVLMGVAPTISPCTHSFFIALEPPLETLVQRFWEVEDVPSLNLVSPEDVKCEHHFRSTYKRGSDGRYTVALPFQLNSSLLGDSYAVALRRFLALEQKLDRDGDLKIHYANIIRDYLAQGHMSKVTNHICSEPHYFIPHHAIFKPNSSTTPVRIVFDASCKTTSLYSLNDLLFVGPKLQADVCTMLLNFRLFAIALSADIRQMYRQINLCENDRKYQKILWRFSSQESIETYQLNTVSFGVRASPFLALRIVRQLAEDEESTFPIAAEIVKRDMYVDDLVTSIPTTSLAMTAYSQLKELFGRGGFQLVKWATNSPTLIENIPEDDCITNPIDFDSSNFKVLGLQWNPKTDFLSFSFDITNRPCTKRTILSTVARCYDPLGFLAPVILNLKLLIKECWVLQLDWDEPCPNSIAQRWQLINTQLSHLLEFEVPRHIGVTNNQSVALVGFADACLTSYGAVVYLQSIANKNQIHLLCAKTKVSPIKLVTIPRLELCAAHLLARLLHFVINCYQSRLNIAKVYAFSDSTVTLNWIATCPTKLPMFVANRVTQINSLIDPLSWYHIDGKNNISDCLSRGLTPLQFISHVSWKNGPDWMRLDFLEWPIRIVRTEDKESEETIALLIPAKEENPFFSLIERCSKWIKLVRSVVYVLRFLRRLPYNVIISASDLMTAKMRLIRLIQCKYFSVELSLLKKGIQPKSFRYLTPFLDGNIIRVGGRLRNADCSFDVKHPILLPKKDRFVDLLIDHYHRSNLHTGPHLVLTLIRQRYWILAARSVIRFRVQKCNICFRMKPKPQFPVMGNLPISRMQSPKAFFQTGCDYAGPVSIIPYRKRGVRSIKAYICLFVCLTTKAVHLELVSSLSTENFLQAFKRFISRRGVVSEINSDNGTNFIGARTSLDELYKVIYSPEYNKSIGNELANRGIQWKLIAPGAPHMGGLWEAGVRSVKSHLYKILRDQLLTYEEFNTLLIQIECVLNSRPLCVLSSDPADPLCLTPAHFLTMGPINHFPTVDYTNHNINRLNRFQLLDRMIQDFWKRWRLECLTEMQTRYRWNTETNPIEIGTVVLLNQPNVPPLSWPLGIIEKTYPGTDQVVRVLDVRTKTGIYRRPVIKVCPLPTQ
ncbi:uncharacterized protein LOC116166263 [Photinus pyralis]|uniref:uncharacterized protein LOC116166263 n=1 Tax=Photinus pyralis TaxID=7054 RepID=UPI0012676FF6|nr:uncharacterized protein LOC116166263 [Photinus pyralis]